MGHKFCNVSALDNIIVALSIELLVVDLNVNTMTAVTETIDISEFMYLFGSNK
jgi:hypothetical protein